MEDNWRLKTKYRNIATSPRTIKKYWKEISNKLRSDPVCISLYVKVLDFRGSYVRELESSQSNPVNGIIKNMILLIDTICTWRCWTRAFYNSYVKYGKLFTRKFAQTILRNHLSFTIFAIKLPVCFM